MESVFEELAVIFLLILANGFFAGSELAIISARKSRIAQLIAAGDEKARIVDQLQNDPHRFLATVQVGVTLVGSLASAVGGAAAVQYVKPLLKNIPLDFVQHAAEPLAIGIVVVVISYLSLIFGELVPKTVGLEYADTMALRVAKPINFLARAAGIVVSFLTLSNRTVLALFGIKAEGNQAFVTREEVQHIVAEGHEAGVFSAAEQEFIQNIFDFTHTCVREVMVPRTRIVALDLELPREELVRTVLENMYSRYPVYRESIENVTGFIHGKDLLGRMVTDPDFAIESIIRPPFYVPEGKKVNELLKEMQRKRIHMALVVDEYGGINGLVTTEDLLEELVGEIEDEHDIGEPGAVQRLADGSLLVDALISISDLAQQLEVKLEEDLPYDTLAGLILDQLGRFPDMGETVEWDRYILVCEEVKATAIVRVRIVEKEPAADAGNE
ncbi:MAG: HlyC/CorC family transporter [Desulfuromonadales bacterium]|nr:MAG: HlyC/CorC family transporter [Desulfuromonadales bacterium]